MIIGVDIRILARGARTGVEEYVINLLSNLFSLEPAVNYCLFYNAYRKVKLTYPWFNLANVRLEDFRIPNRIFFATARYLGQPQLDKLLGGADVYFSPHFFTAPLSKKCRKVITFHDLSFEHYPEFFSWRKRLWQKFLMNTRQEAKEADKIIAVSQSTKDDLVNFYKIEPEKIRVIYSGVGEKFRVKNLEPGIKSQIKGKYHLPEKFILYFGTIEPRKNLIGLIKAFEILKERSGEDAKGLKLVLAGAPGWLYEDIFKAARESKYRQEIIFTGFVEEADKPFLYDSAQLFVYPSLFEGFGFPPLEAMACGLPTIVSANSSLPEVVGEAALMIDPANFEEIAWAAELILRDSRLRERLIVKGLEQAQKFSWQKSAQQTLEVLLNK